METEHQTQTNLEETDRKQPSATSDVQTQETPSCHKPETSSQERLLGAVGYLGPLFIIPMLFKPKSNFCQFHASQGFGMFIALFIILFLSAFSGIISMLLFIAFIVVSVIALYKAYTGIEWKVPVIYKIGHKLNINKYVGEMKAATEDPSQTKSTEDASEPTSLPMETETAHKEEAKKAEPQETPGTETTEQSMPAENSEKEKSE